MCVPIAPSEFIAWKQATGFIVYPSEYATLSAMDDAFVSETNKELTAYRARQQDALRREAEEAKRRGKRG